MSAVRRPLVSEEEFLSLPETMNKTELLDGEVIVSPAPMPLHGKIVHRLSQALEEWAASRPTPTFVGYAPMDVRFAPERILQPDVFVVFGEVDLKATPIEQVPALCVEVLSTNRAHDRVVKRLIYDTAGVHEYWTVEQSGIIERWSGDGLNECQLHEGMLKTSLLEGFSLDIPALFSF